MKWLINEKGMMFGERINIIDFLVLLFVLCLIPMFYFGWKLYNKPRPEVACPEVTCPTADTELRNKVDNLLREHRRLRKYFE